MTTTRGVPHARGDPRSLGAWRTLTTALAVAAAAVLLLALVSAAGSQRLGFDFRAAYLPAAESVREGRSPYVHERRIADADWHPYLYPPQLALALVPATFVSADVAAFIAFLVSFAAVLLALWVVGVRDVRCYAIAFVWAPTWHALEMANLSAVLALALALAWRVRDRISPAAAVLGLAISVKLFLWPVLAWPIVMRRYWTAAGAVAVGVTVTVAAWATIGFAGLTSYPELRTQLGNETSYSIVAVAEKHGYPAPVGDLLSVAAGGACLWLVLLFGRRGDETRAFTSAIAAALALSPSLWQHYLVLLVVPVALARPRFSPLWLLPIALWMSPRAGNGDGLETFVPLVVTAVVLAIVLARPVRGQRAVEVPA